MRKLESRSRPLPNRSLPTRTSGLIGEMKMGFVVVQWRMQPSSETVGRLWQRANFRAVKIQKVMKKAAVQVGKGRRESKKSALV
jgi:hypothetical protein